MPVTVSHSDPSRFAFKFVSTGITSAFGNNLRIYLRQVAPQIALSISSLLGMSLLITLTQKRRRSPFSFSSGGFETNLRLSTTT